MRPPNRRWEVFLWNSLVENRRSSENQKLPEIARKVDISEPRLYNAPSLHTVKRSFGIS